MSAGAWERDRETTTAEANLGGVVAAVDGGVGVTGGKESFTNDFSNAINMIESILVALKCG